MNTHRLLQPAVALLALSAAATSTSALAQEAGDWTLRARVVHMDMPYGSRTAADLGIKNRWIPEVNVGYAISPSFSLELVLPGTQKEDVTSGGSKIGTIKHHSPSLNRPGF